VQAGAGVEKVSAYSSQGASDLANGLPEPLGTMGAGLVASWEVDVWKRLRNASKAARMRYLASIEGRSFAVTRLVAEIADSYYELEALDNRLRVLEENLELQSDALTVLQLQKDAARVTELAVQRFQADMLRNQSRQYEIRQEIVQVENRLNYLCGRYPQPVPRSSDGFIGLTPRPPQSGAPEEILANRPDVRAAEAELEAAKLDVMSARAAFYPALAIDAEAGIEAYALSSLGSTPESVLWGVAGGLVAPLLNRSALRATYEANNAKQVQAVVEYERTVLHAFTEVQTQLSMVENMGQAVQLRQAQVARLREAIETSNGLFRSARADYLEVLTTRRDALESQMELIEAKQRQMAALVDSYQALGGGWQHPDGGQP
jgi:NodT family efflux transporter outer membrane factor (OMF) lipoprotein